ncbi:DUF4352 domain-containing protein [Clostridium pasteurianum]|uniref:DUF4352 domain-containing protein n=1 Tax=Clostridium pasteurianum TaxID=1501 RepID=UPI002260B124|nr:DUF4352 domain-containing protein [Clostridium pasteurianum]UZW13169.1 DUF4352 domain-containing protein [Clostridium pasteurianum]
MQMRNIIILIAAIIISFVAGFFIGDATAINGVNKAINQSTSNATTETNSTGNTSNSKEENKKYKFGEEGKSGNWSIKVLDSQETTTVQAGNSSDNKTTQQKFIVIKLQMTDTDTLPHQYSTNEFILGNTKDKKQYNVSLDALQAANQKETIYNQNGEFFGVYDDINPNIPKQTYVVFEVPKDFNTWYK